MTTTAWPRLATAANFQFSYGAGTDAAVYWRNAEGSGEPVLRMLVLTLHLRPAVPDDTLRGPRGTVPARDHHRWPAAAGENPLTSDWDALLRIYGDDQVNGWRSEGNFTGYRVGIDAAGEWVYFVAGD